MLVYKSIHFYLSFISSFLTLTRLPSLQTPPYTMLRKSSDQLTGNDRFEGFCIDIIKEISRQHGFNYSIEISPDGAYGSKNPITQEWNGIVRELIDHRADLGIVDFTITYEREEAVDFTMPFMNLGEW
ncbi:Glutamate receptor ionotropic, kainate 1 [Portunus trituberculatus]|uniref:Glutamate receptor ionotropic, kainate 1 n=1 Tax=Portunus trituberculatus TaxID=210409 RepID=A0A5B7I3E7_PORTR|nr:Glutamate receptor ionotropic, kainate 1 [Portunus trituberculatus]